MRSVGVDISYTDRRTSMTKLIAAFRNFAKALKNDSRSSYQKSICSERNTRKSIMDTAINRVNPRYIQLTLKYFLILSSCPIDLQQIFLNLRVFNRIFTQIYHHRPEECYTTLQRYCQIYQID
jgi:hypothetical protein